jgi:ferredoxin, 2Fe-2S
MEERLNDIVVHVFYEGQEYKLNTFPNEYRSLMMLIYDRIYTEGFGDCLGMGKCGTCLVEIISSPHELSYYDRNEETTLLRTGVQSRDIRLACQMVIDESIDGLKVNIPSQTNIC